MLPVIAGALEVGGKVVEKAVEVKEVALQEIKEATVIETPDFSTIFNQSLESLMESNTAEGQTIIETTEEEYRKLTVEEYQKIQETTGMSDATMVNCTINEDGVVKLTCINESKIMELTEPPYVEVLVHIEDLDIIVVMPEFQDVAFEVVVPPELYTADDYEMFKYCTEQLKSAIEQFPSLAEQFTPEQVEQIFNGAPRISGLTWHHAAECGKMQLVPTKVHAENRHTGGKAIWGGGRS